MTKIYKIFGLLPISVATLMLTACSSDNYTTETPQAPTEQTPVEGGKIHYVVTVVSSDAATTRATVADDPTDVETYHKTLYFAAGDKLYVSGTDIKGVLDIKTGAGTASASFEGDLTYSGDDTPASDLALTATLVSAQQTVGTEVSVDDAGAVTVNYPATTAFCPDVATAVQKYSRLTGTSTYGEKSFTLTQKTAFMNFNMVFHDGTTTGTSVAMLVKNGTTTLFNASVTTATVDGNVMAQFVLPIPATTALNSATVTAGSNPTISFGETTTLAGQVYNIRRSFGSLTNLTTDKTFNNGDVITGTLTSNVKISIADGATVTLKDVTINGVDDYNCQWAGITCLGNATIILEGTNTVRGFNGDYPGIQAGPTGKLLTINGTGKLTATSNSNGAGIGGPYQSSCGDITINSGIINARSNNNGAGIGCGYNTNSSCGNITINGGTITAYSHNNGAGIGSGYFGASCGNITITGGIVTSISNSNGAGIGSGDYNSSCGKITISSANVTARSDKNGAGIGSGFEGSCSDICINECTITANSGNNGAGIGSGSDGTCVNITISNSNVTAISQINGAGIGSGYNNSSCGDISISNGTIIAYSGCGGGGDGAGIGSGYHGSSCNKITISGGDITARSYGRGAGIGSGFYNSSCGDITITGGDITASSFALGAGIGSGYSSSFSNIAISAGIIKVEAIRGCYEVSGDYAKPIGKGSRDNGDASATVNIDETTAWTAGTATTNLNFAVSTTTVDNDTWTLTPKNP
ncbi:MAG: hypothetical protein K6E15_11230 [Prevotella sp.]|nr:hypothetical protein [Prevotella sp.]